ncbi:MAG: hypothetical protein E7222_13175 [Clostridiales bacterium]|nr:hypothetical protein [Clostridiales bacterium]
MKDYLFMESLFFEDDFENFKSNACHYLKTLGDRKFMEIAISEKWVPIFYKADMPEKAFYVLAMLDYLAQEHNLIEFAGYKEYRKLRLPVLLYPRDAIAADLVSPDDEIKKAITQAENSKVGKFFLKYNILETDIRDAI